MAKKKIEIEIEVDESGGAYSLEEILLSQVGRPFSGEWPRGEGSLSKRAEILMNAGIKALRGWKEVPPQFRILSFDGGGIRGIYSARLLFRLSNAVPEVLHDVGLYAGTSTGAIISVLLSFGMTPEEIFKLYEDHIQEIFADTFIDDVRDVGKLLGSDYTLEPLKKVLTKHLGNATLGDLKNPTLVVSFALDGKLDGMRTWKPKITHNIVERGSDNPDLHLKLVDMVLRSVAAPTYFPSYQGHIDGGVAANDPSMCAVAQALDGRGLGIPLEALRVLSFGTGKSGNYITGDHDWGIAQWAKPLVDILLDGNMGMARYQVQAVLGERYCRVNGSFSKPVGLDAVSAVPRLVVDADTLDLSSALEWLKSGWSQQGYQYALTTEGKGGLS